jgi:aspartate kinase
MPETVVMKFGGTSVASPDDIKRAARRIVAAREGGKRVVAVLSARGKTTDELVAAAYEISDRPLEREMDMLLSTGERIACALCAMAIHDMGHQAISLTGSQAGIVTDSSHTKARILDVRADRIHTGLREDRIVLVAGFQGVSGDSLDVTTLGRGGSDTTAVAIADAVGADVCEIYTDVAGVFSADPRLVPDASKLKLVSFDEMLEMSSSGAGVLQLRAVEYARNSGVRIHCRSSFDDAPGTLVLSESETMERPLVTAVTHAYEARVTLTGLNDEPGVAGSVFGALADANVNVDMIIQNEPVSADSKADLSFTVASDDLERATEVLAPIVGEGAIETDDRVGKVSIVGAGMRSHPGVAAQVFRTLGEGGINIEMISTSPIKISCVIGADGVPDAVRALHAAFELGADAVREEDPSGEHRPRVTS